MIALIKEIVDFLGDVADGKVEKDKARKRAGELHAKAAERFTDDLLVELDRKIAAALEADDTEPG